MIMWLLILVLCVVVLFIEIIFELFLVWIV